METMQRSQGQHVCESSHKHTLLDQSRTKSGELPLCSQSASVAEIWAVSFSVLHLNSSSSRSSGRTSAADTIPIERIPAVIADLGIVSNLFRNTTSSSLASPISQHAVARSPGGGGRARPRSAIFSAALDVFAGAGSSLSSSLKRAHSQTSRTSGVSSSTVVTNQVHMYSQVHSRDSASPGARKLLAQKSAPNLWGASSGSATELAREVSARHHVDLDADVSITGSLIVPCTCPASHCFLAQSV